MPAAQHADDSSAPPGLPHPGPGADIIDLTTRRRTPGPQSSRRHPVQPPSHDDGPTPADRLAIYMDLACELEARFNDAGETLTDPQTARVFKTTLRVVEGFLGGAHDQDVIDAGQREELAAMVQGMSAAADHV